jgi:hypothetical protein
MSDNTGYKGYANLEEYYLDNGIATGVTKTNDVSDPDYVAPVYDLVNCPLRSLSATPSVTPTFTPSKTPTVTPTLTPTPTNTPTISTTPTNTPTISVTPTITPTNTPTKTPTPTPTSTPPVGKPNVISFAAYMGTCYNTDCNDVVTYNMTLDKPTTTLVTYTLQVTYSVNGNIAFSQILYGTIEAGQNYDTVSTNACSGGNYLGCGYEVYSVCVLGVSNNVNINPSYFC